MMSVLVGTNDACVIAAAPKAQVSFLLWAMADASQPGYRAVEFSWRPPSRCPIGGGSDRSPLTYANLQWLLASTG